MADRLDRALWADGFFGFSNYAKDSEEFKAGKGFDFWVSVHQDCMQSKVTMTWRAGSS